MNKVSQQIETKDYIYAWIGTKFNKWLKLIFKYNLKIIC
jgi:hypothetical protein